jgi:heme oxygenase (biliverdin-IX-beta and delta-forming)
VQGATRALWRTNIAGNVPILRTKLLVYKGFVVSQISRQFKGEDVTVQSRLKLATADLHVEVESTLDLDKFTRGAAAYSEAIVILYLVFDRAYKELSDIDFQPLKIDLGSIGRRRDWLATDLHALTTALPTPQSLGFELPTSGHGFGCLYVLEGSALGGRVISKRVKQRLGLGPGTGGAYFHGLGRQTASHWSDFLTTLNTIPVDSAMGADAEAGATATFLAFRQAIQFSHDSKTAPPATFDGRAKF